MADNGIKRPLKDLLDDFHDDTATISTLIRNLALAAIGIIWIFKNTGIQQNIIPRELVVPLNCIIIGLSADLVQYIWRALNTYIYYRIKEVAYDKRQISANDISDIKLPLYIPIGTWVFFVVKIVLVAIAYFHMYNFLSAKI